MLKLTNSHKDYAGETILIAARHIISLRANGDSGSEIHAMGGVAFLVSETLEEIGKMQGWGYV